MSSMSSQIPINSPDPHLVLNTLLNHDSEELALKICAGAEGLSLDDITAFLVLFEKIGFDVDAAQLIAFDPIEYHCVRCHKSYLRRWNIGTVCKIRHSVFTGDPEPHISEYRYKSPSCNQEGIEPHAQGKVYWPNDGFCYTGLHTTDPQEVWYNWDDTLTCEHMGCLTQI